MAFDRLTVLIRNQPMTVDYAHILSLDPIIYGSEATPPLP